MNVVTVARRYKFSASHRLHVPRLSERENDELFGKCNNPFGHGHNYEIEVLVDGEIDPRTGRAVDLHALDELVNEQIIRRYDHRNLNAELPEFERQVPTTENLGKELLARLTAAWPSTFGVSGPALRRIRIFETQRNIFEVVPGAYKSG